MASNYDNSAWFYDSLSRVIFGKAQVNAQIYLLNFIPVRSNILIIGGGTGWILNELANIHPFGLSITYVEISNKMMQLALKQDAGKNHVTYVNTDITLFKPDAPFNVIITPFLLDNFNNSGLDKLLEQLSPYLQSDGMWLCTDFAETGKWWQRLLMQSMYVFFKLLCNIDANQLPDIDACFLKHHYQTGAQKLFYADFIISKQYLKST
jgi:ubiquinone/menaquinone biosynthesis C-methylase UbiE